ncbi:MAG: hypothetical protein Hyperionvirus15_53 [Hyperionvirus sp.]|uniref:Ankyrin repeat protein n=1 Tax=Hyperionvirus sp. TaxID=2487770 RepID=A0A3G5A9V4_9VIRU|nr:MAG: hypothetical protein Hyperionvirus15_53 [Hyperionvirus sp.]
MSRELLSSTSADIEEGTFQLLTQEPNKWISVVRLYNLLSNDHPGVSISKKEFLLKCELLNTRFKNVRKRTRNGVCNLAFVVDDSSLVDGVGGGEDGEKIFKALDKCEVIEYMISNKEYCSNLSLNEFFDGVDTVVHILFRNGRVDLVERLLETFDVDLGVKNSEGKTLLDVVNYGEGGNAGKLIRLVYESQMNALKLKHSGELVVVKQRNTALLEINKKLESENLMLKRKLGGSDLFVWSVVVLGCALCVWYGLA